VSTESAGQFTSWLRGEVSPLRAIADFAVRHLNSVDGKYFLGAIDAAFGAPNVTDLLANEMREARAEKERRDNPKKQSASVPEYDVIPD